ncbi:uncharacterized protein FYW61_018623 [Anableps anableps]
MVRNVNPKADCCVSPGKQPRLRGCQSSWIRSHSSQPDRQRGQHPARRQRRPASKLQEMITMGGLAALCLLLLLPLSRPQSTLQSGRDISARRAPAAAPPHIHDLLVQDHTARLNAKRTYAHVDKDNAKIFLFIAASGGTVALMAAVYCIYNSFYTKQQYLHTQLHDDPDGTADPMDPPGFLHGSAADPSSVCLQKSGYGSLSDTPSIISVPPSLSPPPSAMPFPPPFLSSRSLRTISAQDLEKSCL